jgi:hypothetical protein
VSTNLDVAALALRGLKAAPALGDSTVYLHNKAALRKYAAATYDYFLSALQQAIQTLGQILSSAAGPRR